jgi:hypothetical protein
MFASLTEDRRIPQGLHNDSILAGRRDARSVTMRPGVAADGRIVTAN